MDINDIFRESVTNKTLTSSKRKLGAAPSMRMLQEGGYGIVSSAGDSSKRPRHGDAAPHAGADVGAGSDRDASDTNEREADDDEGGRFFSDGLTAKEKGVLSWVDHMEEVEDALDHSAVQRLILRLERAVSKNTQDRIKHAQSPEDFAESEAELDEAIQRLFLLANDVQYLSLLQDLGALPTLVGLMAHENADIAMDVIQLVVELTAEDSWSQEGESQEERNAVESFVRALAENEFFEMLGENLRRLNEEPDTSEGEADRQGVFQTLSLVENLVSLSVKLAEPAVKSMRLLDWLQTRIAATFAKATSARKLSDSNQQYAAEITSILLQTSPKICHWAGDTFVDALLRCLAKYRKHTPEDDIEMEYLENIVDSLCMLVGTARGKEAFLQLEGVELLVLLQKQQHVARLLSLKILDYALSPMPPSAADTGSDSGDANGSSDGDDQKIADPDRVARTIAKRYIDGLGLKHLFSVFMRHGKGDMQKLFKKHPEVDERAVSCIAWLFRLAGRDTPAHWRVLAKFIPSPSDDSGWKSRIDRLVELNVAFYDRVKEAEGQLGDPDSEDEDGGDGYLLRLDAGLFSLQMTDIIIAFIVGEQQVAERVEQRLRRKGRTMAMVSDELAEYISVKRARSLSKTASDEDSRGNLDTVDISRLLDSL